MLELIRYRQTTTHTLGYIEWKDLVWHTLELPWRDNARNVSRFPAGRYEMLLIGGGLRRIRLIGEGLSSEEDNLFSPRFACDLHIANWVHQIKGCVAVGWGASWDHKRAEPMVTGSKNAMTALYELVEKEKFPELLVVDRF